MKGTDRGTRVKAGQTDSLCRQLIEDGGLLSLAPIAGQIVVTQIVRHHEDDVGLVRAGQDEAAERKAKQRKNERLGHSFSLAKTTFQCSKESGALSRKARKRKPFSSSLSRKLGEPKDEVGCQVKKKNRKFVVPHHYVMDFIKALFGYLKPPTMNLEYEIVGKNKSEESNIKVFQG